MSDLTDELAIVSVLQTGVIAAVAQCDNPALPVAYIDVDFTKPDDGKWLEVIHIPNNRNGDFWSSQKNYQGLLRLVLHWPNNGGGFYAPVGLLASISRYFTKEQPLSGVQISDIPDFTGAVREGSEVLYPISIRYMSYRS